MSNHCLRLIYILTSVQLSKRSNKNSLIGIMSFLEFVCLYQIIYDRLRFYDHRDKISAAEHAELTIGCFGTKPNRVIGIARCGRVALFTTTTIKFHE